MKICIIQTARLGDIYLSWPAINAFRKINPLSHITLIVRHRFAEACKGLKGVDSIIELPSKFLLEPLINDQPLVTESLIRTENWLIDLSKNEFDAIYNLSFSPLSSWITFFIQKMQTHEPKIKGYTRTSDGFLSIPDDMSAYFYGQVGYDKSNQFHLAEIFGTILDVDLSPEDWNTENIQPFPALLNIQSYISIQLGTSQENKQVPIEKWIFLLSELKNKINIPIVLLGSSDEANLGQKLETSSSYPLLINLIGKTTLLDTFSIIKYCDLFVGADSSLQHIASLNQTKSLLLSSGNTNFWETGPRSSGSFIIREANPNNFEMSGCAHTIISLLNNEPIIQKGYLTQSSFPSYKANFSEDSNLAWSLTRTIYQGETLPQIEENTFLVALEKLNDVNQFAIEILNQIKNGDSLRDRVPFLERSEEIIRAIYHLSPSIRPIIDWYFTEKVRIGPGTEDEVLNQTLHIHSLLEKLVLYILDHTEKLHKSETQCKTHEAL